MPPNGDQNPYAVLVAPVSLGKMQKDDVLVTNFNNSAQPAGPRHHDRRLEPGHQDADDVRDHPAPSAACPGGVGLTTAMTMLKTGWVIVGSLPSQDGTTATKGDGCLLILDAQGHVAGTLAGPNINGPWGNMAVSTTAPRRRCSSATPASAWRRRARRRSNKATVLRIELAMPAAGPPRSPGRR